MKDSRDVIECYIVPADNGYTVTIIDKEANIKHRWVEVTENGVACRIEAHLIERVQVLNPPPQCEPEAPVREVLIEKDDEEEDTIFIKTDFVATNPEHDSEMVCENLEHQGVAPHAAMRHWARKDGYWLRGFNYLCDDCWERLPDEDHNRE